jgi:hypothetical protein
MEKFKTFDFARYVSSKQEQLYSTRVMVIRPEYNGMVAVSFEGWHEGHNALVKAENLRRIKKLTRKRGHNNKVHRIVMTNLILR